MPKRNLTDQAVKRIKPPETGQVDHFDQGYPGLSLRVGYGGTKTWVLHYRRPNGKQSRCKLGTYPALSLADAREKWREARGVIDSGGDPAKAKPRGTRNTVASVAEQWLKRDQAKNRSVGEVTRVLNRDVLPEWGDRQITSISRGDVNDLIDQISDRAPVLARRVHSYLHRMFRWAAGRGIVELNPMADLPKLGKETPRKRVLTDHEVALVWKATGEIGGLFGSAFRLLLLTGARLAEIGELKWSEIDVAGRTIKLTGERTKNGEPHDIPLSDAALEVIGNLPRLKDTDLVFTTTGRTPMSGWSKAKTKLDNKLAELNDSEPIPHWRTHDMRRTVATGLQKLGTNLQVIEAVLNHISGSRGGIVGVYQRHSYADEKRIALNKWAAHVEAIATGKAAKVLQFPGT